MCRKEAGNGSLSPLLKPQPTSVFLSVSQITQKVMNTLAQNLARVIDESPRMNAFNVVYTQL